MYDKGESTVKPVPSFSAFARFIAVSALLALGACAQTPADTRSDPLASWNDGTSKQAIVAFVKETTTQGSPKFVPQEERIATFDQDGTLWVSHPMYTQVMFVLERVPVLVKAKPELATVAPYSTVLEILKGDRAAVAKLSEKDLFELLAATSTGMPVETFQAEAKKWLAEAKDPRWKRPYTELTYLPMQEVLKYLRANGYKTYIVTGGGQDFVRVYAERVYGIPPEQVVGSAGGDELRLRQGRQAVPDQGPEATAQRQQRRQARGHSPDDWAATVCSVRQLDRRPADARVHQGRRRRAAVNARAARRRKAGIRLRPAQGLPDTKVGTFPQALYDEARKQGWVVISMKNDWKKIFAFE